MIKAQTKQKQQEWKRKRKIQEIFKGNFSGGPVVKNPPSNAGDVGWIPGWGTKIPCAMGKTHVPKLRLNVAKFKKKNFKRYLTDFLGGPVVKNPPTNVGEADSIPGWGTKIPRAAGNY